MRRPGLMLPLTLLPSCMVARFCAGLVHLLHGLLPQPFSGFQASALYVYTCWRCFIGALPHLWMYGGCAAVLFGPPEALRMWSGVMLV
eukprot:4793158-Amphidinium_carterae.1